MPPEEAPFISIVVPTANRTELLADCVDSLVAQDYPAGRFEVIVVHNGTPEPAPRTDPPQVRRVHIARRDANAARNAGVLAARGDPICLVDDDVVAPPHWLRSFLAGVGRHPGADCFGGPVRPRFEADEPRTCALHELAGAQLDEGPDEVAVEEVWSCNMAVRRSALERVGDFRERLPVLHESEWEGRLLKLGGRIAYLPQAWLWHRRLASDVRPWSLARDNFLLGYAVVALGQEPAAGYLARLAAVSLGHAARRRCARGFTDAMRALGSLSAVAAGRRRRPWATSLR